MPDRLHGVPEQHDLVVVGGGINGAGVARDAALRGLAVALVEQHDFAAGSSSRTSKLVHGGVRYLEHGALHLVWEACHERSILLRVAPHLVRPLPFVFPVYRDSRFGPLRLRAGMWLYDALAAFRNVRRHRMLAARSASSWGEGLRTEALRGAALYYDAAMDDARLVLANVLAARAAGAHVLSRVEVTNVEAEPAAAIRITLRDRYGDRSVVWRARCVVVCAGPWSNRFLAGVTGGAAPLAPTRGTHIVVRRIAERAFTLAAGRDGRVIFVLPWLGRTLVGTTDVDDGGDPERVAPTEVEIAYLLAEANRFFPAARLQRSDVLAAFAGLRPLLRSAESAAKRSREHAILEPRRGVFAVVGGKYTTYRAVAAEVVDRVVARLGRRAACRTADLPLPGGDLAWSAADQWNAGPRFVAAVRALATQSGVSEATASHWFTTHGSRAPELAALASAEPALATPLCPHQPHTGADIVHAVRAEMALELEDWFLRRSRVAFGPCNGLDALAPVAAIFGRELGWDAAQTTAAVAACRSTLQRTACRGDAA